MRRFPEGSVWIQPTNDRWQMAALHQLYVLERQTAHRFAGCRKNRVEYGWRNHADCRFPNATPEVVGRHNHRFDLRHFDKTHNLVTVEVEIGHAPVLDRHFAVERGSETEGHRSLNLRLDLAGVNGMAAIDRQRSEE